MSRKIHIAVPAQDEYEGLRMLMHDLENQSFKHFDVIICINQPNEWWYDETKKIICENNKLSLEYLKSFASGSAFNCQIIDRSSPGLGWGKKYFGVGWARKTAMDMAAKSDENDLILCLDADTHIEDNYVEAVYDSWQNNLFASGFSIPYFHKLNGNEPNDLAILRYEIYMRSYAINLFRIANPYRFTAIGSSMAAPVWAYRRIKGITPRISGEDFYFMQQLCKTGRIVSWVDSESYPSSRPSERVVFGTGPAVKKGMLGQWESYPIYDPADFDLIKQTTDLFEILFEKDQATPLDNFLIEVFGELPWCLLRKNNKDKDRFVHACHEKLDALRILQFLKSRNSGNCHDTIHLMKLMQLIDSKILIENNHHIWNQVTLLDTIRMELWNHENKLRKNEYLCNLNQDNKKHRHTWKYLH